MTGQFGGGHHPCIATVFKFAGHSLLEYNICKLDVDVAVDVLTVLCSFTFAIVACANFKHFMRFHNFKMYFWLQLLAQHSVDPWCHKEMRG